MRPNLLKEREVEKKHEDKSVEKEQQNETLPEPKDIYVSQKIDVEPIKPSLPKVNLFSSATYETLEKPVEKSQPKLDTRIYFEPEFEKEEQAIQEQVPVFEEKIETTERDFYEIDAKPKLKSKPSKFRFRLLTCIYCAIIAVCTGWVITNAVRIGTAQSTIEASQSSFNINELKYIKKIEQLDDLKDTSQNPSDSSLMPIEEVITIQPAPLENPTDYAKKSNWFDKICNWFGHLFGG